MSHSMAGRRSGRDGELRARMMLSHAAEPGDPRLGSAIMDHGAIQVVERLDAGRGAAVGLQVLQRRWDRSRQQDDADHELARAQELNVDFLVPADPGWPTQLADLGCLQPVLLRVMGAAQLRSAAVRSVAVVGARAATRYGQSVAEQLGSELALLGWAVVSGGAFGIDAAAHRGALAAGGVSIAVSAAGVDRPAPAANTSLYMALYDTGVVVSEVPLGSTPRRSRFLVRNRLIAALARCVVVVEAAERSGARSTARQAQSLGRVVAAVPGPVTSAMSAGCHAMVRDEGAVLVGEAAHIVELLTVGLHRSAQRSAAVDALAAPERQLFAALSIERAVPAETLAAANAMTIGSAVTALLLLESLGLAFRDRNGWVKTGGR